MQTLLPGDFGHRDLSGRGATFPRSPAISGRGTQFPQSKHGNSPNRRGIPGDRIDQAVDSYLLDGKHTAPGSSPVDLAAGGTRQSVCTTKLQAQFCERPETIQDI